MNEVLLIYVRSLINCEVRSKFQTGFGSLRLDSYQSNKSEGLQSVSLDDNVAIDTRGLVDALNGPSVVLVQKHLAQDRVVALNLLQRTSIILVQIFNINLIYFVSRYL